MKQLTEIKERFERYFLNVLDGYKEIPSPLNESIRYSALSGGKRFRPALFIQACEMFGFEADDSVLHFACALEFLHNYTLVHDDLPAIDNDDYRRGRLTNHRVFGENIAILAGDALLNIAYETALKSVLMAKDMKNAASAAAEFARLCGAECLIAGQTADILSESVKSSAQDNLYYIYTHKTCDLIAASVVCAAIFCGATGDETDAIRDFAYNFGFAFQLKDDMLDKDDENRGRSALDIYSEEEIFSLIGKHSENAVAALGKIQKNTEFFKDLTEHFINRNI